MPISSSIYPPSLQKTRELFQDLTECGVLGHSYRNVHTLERPGQARGQYFEGFRRNPLCALTYRRIPHSLKSMQFTSRVEVCKPNGDWLFTTHAEHAHSLVLSGKAKRKGKKDRCRRIELIASEQPGGDYDVPSLGRWKPTFRDSSTQPETCEPCRGSGRALLGDKCRTCHGSGKVHKIIGYYVDLSKIPDAQAPFFSKRHAA